MRLRVQIAGIPRLKIAHWPPEWQQCMQDYLQTLYDRSGSEATLENYTSMLGIFFDSPKQACEMASSDVMAYISRPLMNGPSAGLASPEGSTRNTRRAAVSGFYRFASTYYIAPGEPLFTGTNPCLGVGQARRKESYRAISDEDLSKIFSVIPRDERGERDRTIYMWLLICTRRRSEIINLTASDIQPANFPDGRGGRRVGRVFHFRGKGRGMIDDSMELPEEVYRQLLTYLAMSGRSLASMDPDMPLFVSHPVTVGAGLPTDPWRAVTTLAISQQLKKYARWAGVEPTTVTLHGLRHSGARARADAGEDLRSIAKVMRHKNVSHTDRYLSVLLGTSDPGSAALTQRYGHLLS